MVEAVIGIDKGEHQQRGHKESYCAGYSQVFHVLSPHVVKDALQHDEEQNYSLKEKSGRPGIDVKAERNAGQSRIEKWPLKCGPVPLYCRKAHALAGAKSK